MAHKRKTTGRNRARRPLAAIVLAAGEGKRMRSRKAKVLHEIAGKPMLVHVLDAVAKLKPDKTVAVIASDASDVRAVVGDRAVCTVQERPLGSGHAALQARAALRGFDGDVLVLCGDVPLITPATLKSLLARARRSDALATVLAMVAGDPDGYGRVIDEGNGRVRIVEHADASADERAVDLVNTGTYCFDAKFLFRALSRLGRNNALGEYYLTDVLGAASKQMRARSLVLDDAGEGLGVNSRLDLVEAEALFQHRLALAWLARGVTFLDPSTVYISAYCRIGRDSVIGPNVRIEGSTRIGTDCRIEGSCHLRDSVLGAGTHVRWGVVADGARVGRNARIGPYAHLRPGSDLGDEVHIGNFVEVKNAKIGARSKANHLAYIGDASVGRDVNVGAGTITCNYDGFRKSRTVIGDRVQIGSDTQLVAPVTLGEDVYVAAGSTVTRDVEAGALVYNDKPQRVRRDWVAGFRKRSRAAVAKERG